MQNPEPFTQQQFLDNLRKQLEKERKRKREQLAAWKDAIDYQSGATHPSEVKRIREHR